MPVTVLNAVTCARLLTGVDELDIATGAEVVIEMKIELTPSCWLAVTIEVLDVVVGCADAPDSTDAACESEGAPEDAVPLAVVAGVGRTIIVVSALRAVGPVAGVLSDRLALAPDAVLEAGLSADPDDATVLDAGPPEEASGPDSRAEDALPETVECTSSELGTPLVGLASVPEPDPEAAAEPVGEAERLKDAQSPESVWLAVAELPHSPLFEAEAVACPAEPEREGASVGSSEPDALTVPAAFHMDSDAEKVPELAAEREPVGVGVTDPVAPDSPDVGVAKPDPDTEPLLDSPTIQGAPESDGMELALGPMEGAELAAW